MPANKCRRMIELENLPFHNSYGIIDLNKNHQWMLIVLGESLMRIRIYVVSNYFSQIPYICHKLYNSIWAKDICGNFSFCFRNFSVRLKLYRNKNPKPYSLIPFWFSFQVVGAWLRLGSF